MSKTSGLTVLPIPKPRSICMEVMSIPGSSEKAVDHLSAIDVGIVTFGILMGTNTSVSGMPRVGEDKIAERNTPGGITGPESSANSSLRGLYHSVGLLTVSRLAMSLSSPVTPALAMIWPMDAPAGIPTATSTTPDASRTTLKRTVPAPDGSACVPAMTRREGRASRDCVLAATGRGGRGLLDSSVNVKEARASVTTVGEPGQIVDTAFLRLTLGIVTLMLAGSHTMAPLAICAEAFRGRPNTLPRIVTAVVPVVGRLNS